MLFRGDGCLILDLQLHRHIAHATCGPRQHGLRNSFYYCTNSGVCGGWHYSLEARRLRVHPRTPIMLRVFPNWNIHGRICALRHQLLAPHCTDLDVSIFWGMLGSRTYRLPISSIINNSYTKLGIMISSAPRGLKAFANSSATTCMNLFGYLPAPLIYGMFAE